VPRMRTLACIAVLFVGACSDNTVAPPLHPYDGNWAGQTSDGRRVQIRIDQSRIVFFETLLSLPTCGLFLTQEPHAPINGNQFTFGVSMSSFTTTLVNGKFETERRITGTLSAVTRTSGSSLCGSDASFAIPERTFTADQ
jgi:hypothetical protein